jgi:hypothetical protein
LRVQEKRYPVIANAMAVLNRSQLPAAPLYSARSARW